MYSKKRLLLWVLFVILVITAIPLTASAVNVWQPVGNTGFSADYADSTSVFVDNGTPYVAYVDWGNNGKATVKKYDGTNWVDVGSPGFSAGEVDYTALYVDSGTPYVAYMDAGNGYKATAKKFDGTDWVDVGNAGFSAAGAYYTSLYVDNGTPYVAYTDDGNSRKATVKKFDGTNWVEVGNAGLSAAGAYYTSLHIDNGTPYLAYSDQSNSGKTTVMKFDGVNWVEVGSAGFSGGNARYISLSVSNGMPYVAYSDINNSGKATVKKFDGTEWVDVGTPGFSEDWADYTSLFVDNGTPYIAFSDWGSNYNGKARVMEYNGSDWVDVGSPGLSPGEVENTSLYIYDGTPYVVYTDWQNDGKATVMCFGPAYTVTFDKNGGDTEATPSTKTAPVGGNVGALPTPPLRSGYVFDKWTTNQDGTGTEFNAATPVSEDITVYAQWSEDNTWPVLTAGTVSRPNGAKATVTFTSDKAGTYYYKVVENNSGNPGIYPSDSGTYDGYGSTAAANTETIIELNNLTSGAKDIYIIVKDQAQNESDPIKIDIGGAHWNILGDIAFDDYKTDNTLIATDSNGNMYAAMRYWILGDPAISTDDVYPGVVMKYNKVNSEWEQLGDYFVDSTADFSLTVYNDVPYVAFRDDSAGYKLTVKKFNSSTSSWEIVGSQGFSDGIAGKNAITIDSSGTPYVFYQDPRTNPATTYAATVKKFDGANWVTVGSDQFTAGTDHYYDLSLAIAPDGTPYVAYRDQASSGFATVKKFDGSAWVNVGVAGFSEGLATNINIFFDGDTPCIGYRDVDWSRTPQIKAVVKKFNGTDWEDIGDTSAYGSFDWFSVTMRGSTPYLVFSDQQNNNKTTVVKFNGLAWETVGSPGFSCEYAGYNDIAVDPDGNPIIIMVDGNTERPVVMFGADPGEDISTVDTTIPVLAAGTVNRTSDTSATVKFTSNEAGQYYYAVVADGAARPIINTSGTGTVVAADTETTISLTELTAGAKDIYIKVKDAAGNYNRGLKIDIPAYGDSGEEGSGENDATPPTLNAGTVARTSDATATVKFTSDEAGEYYYAIVADGAAVPVIDTEGAGIACGTIETTISNPIGLTAGAKDIYIVVKDAAGNLSEKLKIDIPAYMSSGTSDSSSNNNNNTTDGINTQINGENQQLGTVQNTNNNGVATTTVILDPAKIEQQLANKTGNAMVTIVLTNNSADVVVGQLNGTTVKNMEKAQAMLVVETPAAKYILPAAQINIDNVSTQIGQQVKLKDIKVNVTIAAPPVETLRIVEDAANKNNYQVIVKPVEFEITCTSGSKTVEVSKFNGYVERTVAVPDGVDPSKITTGVVLNADGTFSHVPTKIIVIDGKYYAKINSLTNSTYSVIWNPMEFKDVAAHWAKEAVNDMGSRLVVSGYDKNTYSPDKAITRAEFATIMVKALGLKPQAGQTAFSDVKTTDWYSGFVGTAVEYGLISGYGNGKFRPNDKITREQAMTIVAKAMKLTKLNVEFDNGEIASVLATYADSGRAAGYAKAGIAACIKNGVVTGKGGSLVAPKDNITRAEVAVIARGLLQKSGLI